MSSSRLTRSRRRESSGEEPFVMENPRVPETIPSPSVDPLPIPSTISQIDLLKIMSQQQEAAERQQQQLLQLLLDQQEQRKREQEQQLEQRRREQEQQLEQRRLDREAQERSETSLHELFRTTVAALQAVHQVNGSGEPAVTPRGSGVITPLPSPVPSPVPVPAVRQVRHPGQFQDVRDLRSVPFTRGVVESPIGRVTVNNEVGFSESLPQVRPQYSHFNQLNNSGFPEVASQINEKPLYPLKPPIFDGKVPWADYERQFNTIAKHNQWDSAMRAHSLASCLRTPALNALTLEFDTVYNPGKENIEADCPSRNPVLESHENADNEANFLQIEEIKENQKLLIGDSCENNDDIIYKRLN
ncbi:forkhead box protein P2-like [Neodiprion lecontei]|uniref:Forkhead box protein P2-like n=1 Tax=Neodiprion lecontei TaxID=441921 RepID=A0ABM3GNV7_NEOLC|nr:forkhead box protein P2-like [Neodiprion lecontei]